MGYKKNWRSCWQKFSALKFIRIKLVIYAKFDNNYDNTRCLFSCSYGIFVICKAY